MQFQAYCAVAQRIEGRSSRAMQKPEGVRVRTRVYEYGTENEPVQVLSRGPLDLVPLAVRDTAAALTT